MVQNTFEGDEGTEEIGDSASAVPRPPFSPLHSEVARGTFCACVNRRGQSFVVSYSVVPLFRYSVIPYSAFYSVPNPIELVFSKVKSFWKANDLVVQSKSCPRTLVMMAFNTITQQDTFGYIRHFGFTF